MLSRVDADRIVPKWCVCGHRLGYHRDPELDRNMPRESYRCDCSGFRPGLNPHPETADD